MPSRTAVYRRSAFSRASVAEPAASRAKASTADAPLSMKLAGWRKSNSFIAALLARDDAPVRREAIKKRHPKNNTARRAACMHGKAVSGRDGVSGDPGSRIEQKNVRKRAM